MLFGFPPLTTPFTNSDLTISTIWNKLLVQMANVLGTVNYGTSSVAHGGSVGVVALKPGQSARVLAFDMASSVNNASANAFYDGTTLTISNLVTNGSGVSITASGTNIEVSNTNPAGTLTIAWRAA